MPAQALRAAGRIGPVPTCSPVVAILADLENPVTWPMTPSLDDRPFWRAAFQAVREHSRPLSARLSAEAQALLAWSLFAGPAIALMTLMLTLMLQRVPALAKAENGD